MSFRIKDTRDKRIKEARHLYARVDEFKSDSNWDAYQGKMEEYDLQWRGRLPRLKKPWDHASDFNPHLTWSKVEDVHSVLFSFFSTFNWYSAIPVSIPDSPGADKLKARGEYQTELLKWSMQNESNAVGFLDRFIHDGVCYGAGYGETKWLKDIRQIRQEYVIPSEIRTGRDLDIDGARNILIEAIGDKLMSKTLRGNNTDGYVAEFIDDDGEKREGRFWVDDEHPFRSESEIVVIAQRESVMYNAPHSRNIAPWHFLVPPYVRSLQNAERYWVVDYMTLAQIDLLYRLGVFNAVSTVDIKKMRGQSREELERMGIDPNQPVGSGRGTLDLAGMDEQRDDEMAAPRKNEGREKNTFEVVFEYAFEDVDGDGVPESIIRAVTDHPEPILLMRHRLEYLFPHGRRPHCDWHLYPLDDRYNGMGIPELLERAQREENAYYQARSDVLEIITKPGGIYDPLSGLAPDEIKYSPGMLIKGRNPQGAFAPFMFPNNPDFLFKEQVGIDRDAERAVGATDMGLGRQSGQPNAPRTLGGTAIMVRQQQLRTDTYLRRVMYGQGDRPSGLMEWVHQYRELMASFMPEQKELLITGRNEVQTVRRDDLQGRYTFIVSFDQEINNPQLRAVNAVQRYSLLKDEPLLLQNVQARWHIVQDFLRSTGLTSSASILPPPQQGADHPPWSQSDEFFMMSKGQPVKVLMDDPHENHLAEIQALVQDQLRLASLFSSSTLFLLEEHAKEHMQYLMATAQQRVPSAAGANGTERQPNNILQPNTTLAQTGLGRPESVDVEAGF